MIMSTEQTRACSGREHVTSIGGPDGANGCLNGDVNGLYLRDD
jgi:hypothetical protein